MISGPVCQNNKCQSFNVFKKDSVIKVPGSINRYLCKKCNKEFEWSMPKKKYGITY